MSTGASHVLLVDDDPRGLEFLSVRLRANGYRITAAEGGEAAMAVVERDPPDAIVLDVTMPDLNGYQVCRAIKRLSPKLPILILTAKSDPADRFWAFQSGADAFLNKPVDPVTVVEKLKALLGGS